MSSAYLLVLMPIPSPRTIKLSTRSRSAPNLESFIERFLFNADWRAYAIASSSVLAFGALGCSVSGVLLATGQLQPGFLLWILANVFGLTFVGGLIAHLWLRRRRPVNIDKRLVKEAKDVARQLKASMTARRLHRELNASVFELLEEASRCWKRVYEATDGAFWRSSDLPVHYQGVRAQARASADQAMMEILLSLRTGLKQLGQPRTLVEGLQSVMDAIGISVNNTGNTDPLPAGFDEAGDLAKNLSELASEIELTSLKAIKSSSAVADSSQNIRQTLEELKQIREAESEIDQHIRASH